jgi:hypothetical protein
MAKASAAILLLLTCLLFTVSISILGLISHSLAYTDSNYAANTVASFQQDRETYDANGVANGTESLRNTFGLLPESLDEGSYWMIFAAGMGGVLDALMIAIFTLRKKPIVIRFPRGKVRLSSSCSSSCAAQPRQTERIVLHCLAKASIFADVPFPRFHGSRLRIGFAASRNWNSNHRFLFCRVLRQQQV